MVESVRAGRVGGSAPVSRNASRTAETPFVVDDGAAPLDQKARLSSVVGIGLENLLALQAVDEGTERRRKATRRGTAMIAALRDLQHGLLAGNDPRAALRVLNELVPGDASAEGEASGDAGLDAIARAIVLRARVEIARRDRQSG